MFIPLFLSTALAGEVVQRDIDKNCKTQQKENHSLHGSDPYMDLGEFIGQQITYELWTLPTGGQIYGYGVNLAKDYLVQNSFLRRIYFYCYGIVLLPFGYNSDMDHVMDAVQNSWEKTDIL